VLHNPVSAEKLGTHLGTRVQRGSLIERLRGVGRIAAESVSTTAGSFSLGHFGGWLSARRKRFVLVGKDLGVTFITHCEEQAGSGQKQVTNRSEQGACSADGSCRLIVSRPFRTQHG
jgi:hypothetical protein